MALSKKAALALEGLAKRGDSFARHAINKYITPRDTMLLKSLAKRGDLVARRHLQGLNASVSAKELVHRKAKEGDFVMQGLDALPPPVVKTAQTIAWDAGMPVDALQADSPILLLATATSGLAVVFSVVSGPATIANGDELTITDVTGTVVLAANQAGDADYLAATQVTHSITITG
jgi:hypothetical protein